MQKTGSKSKNKRSSIFVGFDKVRGFFKIR